MKPLFHPATDDLTVQGILHALSDPARVHIFSRIADATCAQTCSAFAEIDGSPIPKSTLSQHFKVLRDAGLIRSERKGVEMHNVARCAEVDGRFPGLVGTIVGAYKAQRERDRRAERRRLARER